jgi:hypothetical protein
MYSLTILDLPLSLLPPSQEYPYLGVPTLGTQQNTTVTLAKYSLLILNLLLPNPRSENVLLQQILPGSILASFKVLNLSKSPDGKPASGNGGVLYQARHAHGPAAAFRGV